MRILNQVSVILNREGGSLDIEMSIVGRSAAVRECIANLNLAAKSDKTVLIHGETGSGKDLAALWIHLKSARNDSPFIPINCACLSEYLFEEELFGHVRGAFTGAYRDAGGLLEAADQGTVLFDEIGEMPASLQSKMLRLIDNKETRRIGESRIRNSGARLLFATNKNLVEEVNNGRFRKDLYYRINILYIRIPPLRERMEDLPGLAHIIINKENERSLRKQDLTPLALAKLMSYEYPGNVRELENVIIRAMTRGNEKLIYPDAIQFEEAIPEFLKKGDPLQLKIRSALEKWHWNKTKAAREIGISRRHFYRLLKRYPIKDLENEASL